MALIAFILAAMITQRLNNAVRRSALVALPLLSLAIAGCGSSSSTSDTKSLSGDAKIFADNCGRCHTLKAAGTKGVVGPDLDKSKPSLDKVKDRVMNGRRAMPPLKSTLSPDEIDAVANYVAIGVGR